MTTDANATPEAAAPAVELPKGVDQATYDEVKGIMISGFQAKQTPDAIKSAIFGTGKVPFSVLNRLFNLIGKNEGLVVNPKEMHAAIRVELSSYTLTFNETYEQLSTLATAIKEAVKGSSKQKVLAVMKKFFKDSDKSFPKKPITTGSKMGVTFRVLIDLFANNPQTTELECIEALKAVVEKEQNAINYGKMYHKVLYAAANGLTADEVLKDLYGEED